MSKFSPCFIIPNYNHNLVFEDLIIRLSKHQLPIIIVNDGSNLITTKLINDIQQKINLVFVLHLPVNCGKGHAVIAGIHLAKEKKFTHAFQIDADGQHDLASVDLFLEACQKNVDKIVCGFPVYDSTVPKIRLISRYITHFWVWVETLSFDIKDSMCGFRIYPVQHTLLIADNAKLGKRMDFDTDILVRLYWAGKKPIFLPVKVKYPENGVSHFNLLRDNWLITKMHTRLFFGMLTRLPKLLRLKFTKKKPVKKKQDLVDENLWFTIKEKGSVLGLKILIYIYKTLGRKVFLLVLHPVILYYVVFSKTLRKNSRQYWENLFAYQNNTQKVKFRHIYSHVYQFAVCAIDKVACWTGDIKAQDVIFHNQELFNKIVNSGKGAIFISAHLGNLELCRAIGERISDVKINAIVFNKNALKFQKVLAKSNPQVNVNLLHVESMGADTAILLKDKIEQGEIIVIVGDRVPVHSQSRTQYADFLGKTAAFSEGPYILASILDCPSYLLFCIKQRNVYNIYFEAFYSSLKFPRAQRKRLLSKVIQQYADRLAFYCQKAPFQWFNFYDFWQLKKIQKAKEIENLQSKDKTV